MSSKAFYVALYMLEFKTKDDTFSSKTIVTKFVSIFENHDQLMRLNFVKDFGLIDLFIYRWEKIFFFILIGNQHLIKNWSIKLKYSLILILNNLFLESQYEDFILEDLTYSSKSKARRLGSVGSALRRIITTLYGKYNPKTLKEDGVKSAKKSDNKINNNNFNDLELCIMLYNSKAKIQKIDEIFSSVIENRKIPQLDLSYYALFDKKQKILNKLDLISEENTSNNEKFNSNENLKAELKELVEAI